MVAVLLSRILGIFMFIRQKGSRDSNADKREADTAPLAGNDAGKNLEGQRPVPTTTPTVRTTAMIGATVKIKGDISSDENLVIEGQVEGTITLNSHELVVGQSGRVSANVSAKSVRIDGQLNGDVVGKERIVISKSGNVRGNLMAPTVILEEGGKFKGSIDMGSSAGSTVEPPIADFANAARAQRSQGEGKAVEAAVIKHG